LLSFTTTAIANAFVPEEIDDITLLTDADINFSIWLDRGGHSITLRAVPRLEVSGKEKDSGQTKHDVAALQTDVSLCICLVWEVFLAGCLIVRVIVGLEGVLFAHGTLTTRYY